jgi:peroxiredoxin
MDNLPIRDQGGSASFRSFILKSVIVGIVIFVGIAGGIYTGSLLASQKSDQPSADALRNRTFLEIGDSFPDYQFKDVFGGTQTGVSQLAGRGPVLLAFVSRGCDACEHMLSQWRRKVMSQMDKRIQVVLVYAEDEGSPEELREAPVPGTLVVTTDRKSQKKIDGITSSPVLIGLDPQGKITMIISGFDSNVGSGYFNKHLK